jgi:hypothetical protein
MREKVTGTALTLDDGLRSALPVLLSLIDARQEDEGWDSLQASRGAPSGGDPWRSGVSTVVSVQQTEETPHEVFRSQSGLSITN